MDTPASEPARRSALLAAALEQADWALDQLWVNYLAVGGTAGIFELEAHLADLDALPSNQHDPLACALNERLADLGNPLRVPFTTHLDDDVAVRNALDVIEQLLPAGSGRSPSAASRARLRWHGRPVQNLSDAQPAASPANPVGPLPVESRARRRRLPAGPADA